MSKEFGVQLVIWGHEMEVAGSFITYNLPRVYDTIRIDLETCPEKYKDVRYWRVIGVLHQVGYIRPDHYDNIVTYEIMIAPSRWVWESNNE